MKNINEVVGNYLNHDYIVKIFNDGHRTGYVKIDDIEIFNKIKNDYRTFSCEIDCHGGLTFIETVKNSPFLPDGNWIGFDCAHDGDIPDKEGAEAHFKETNFFFVVHLFDSFYGSVKTKEFVETECKGIIHQIVEMTGKNFIGE